VSVNNNSASPPQQMTPISAPRCFGSDAISSNCSYIPTFTVSFLRAGSHQIIVDGFVRAIHIAPVVAWKGHYLAIQLFCHDGTTRFEPAASGVTAMIGLGVKLPLPR
jgi:hypothetical protein